jgi:hypothetical protein
LKLFEKIAQKSQKCEKIFLEMTLLEVKTYGEPEFDIFEAKNASLIQGRPVY